MRIYSLAWNMIKPCRTVRIIVQTITSRDEVNNWGGWNYYKREKLVSHY
jgi:hypothetical protein